MKRTVCILLSLMLALAGLVGLGMTSSAVYKVGSTYTFGSYPQTEVTSELGSTLNALGGAWTSYNYGTVNGKDCMQYKDVMYNGAKYRGVSILENRPIGGSYSNTQKDNNYLSGNVYWFKWEPLQWRVLDPSTGFILCSSIIDSQPFQSNLSLYAVSGNKYYPCNYAESNIRTWLNNSFLKTAFTASEQAAIQTTTLDNKSALSNLYDSATTNDKVFLLSMKDATTRAYGFAGGVGTFDANRRLKGTAYAKCQGLWVSAGNYAGYSDWWLRTPYSPIYCCGVEYEGYVFTNELVTHTNFGVCPAVKIGDLNAGITLSGVSIKSMPSKTVYTVGEDFDDSGLTLTASYSDGDLDTIELGFTCTGFNSGKTGVQTITVTYGGKSTTFTVTVKPASGSLTGIAVKKMPNKTVYTYRKDQNLDTAGLELEASYSDGSKIPVDPSACTITGYSAKPAGNKTITVEFEGKTTQFDVTVKYAWWQWLIRIFLLGFIWY